MDNIEFMKALEKRAADAEIDALRLQWENERLVKALRDANREIARLGGRQVSA